MGVESERGGRVRLAPPSSLVGRESDVWSDEDLTLIRALDDFDLRMLLSEISDSGWAAGLNLLGVITSIQGEK